MDATAHFGLDLVTSDQAPSDFQFIVLWSARIQRSNVCIKIDELVARQRRPGRIVGNASLTSWKQLVPPPARKMLPIRQHLVGALARRCLRSEISILYLAS
jgi:hypothetical protein